MAIIFDTTEQLEASETEGNIDFLRRRFLATGAVGNDSTVLWEALNAVGIPRANEWAPGNTNLVCTGRQVRLLQNSKHRLEVVCEYRPIGSTNTNFIFSGGTRLAQESTQVDRFGNQIFVGHVWPSDDPHYPSQTQLQGLDLVVLQPQATMQAVGQLQVAYPDYVSRLWTGSMNAAAWSGAGPYEWMCVGCDWDPLDVGYGRLRRWQFRFEFQHRPTGWTPQTWFIDSRTSKPPKDLVPGFGIKNVDWYGILDFNILFPIR